MAPSSNVLTLTNAVADQAQFALVNSTFSASTGLAINFDFYSYGGTGGDGISVFLVDGAFSPTSPGAFGGSLGYAQKTDIPGLAGAYVGIGLDEFGNFANPIEGRVGGTRITPDSVTIRGGVATNYGFITNTGTLPYSLDVPGAGVTPEQAKRSVRIELTAAGSLSIFIDSNADGDFNDLQEKPIQNFNLAAVNGALPSTFKVGFAAATGVFTNIHQVDNITVQSLTSGSGGLPPTLVGDLGLIVTGGPGNDILSGLGRNDALTGGPGADVINGGGGADRFIYSGRTKAAALRTSTLRSRDWVQDFNQSEGDRFQLDFNNRLSDSELPKRLFSAGQQQGKNLTEAVQNAYGDRNGRGRGRMALGADEAIFFQFGRRMFLSVNDNRSPFSARQDLLVEVTGISFRPGEPRTGTLGVRSYFA
jgi:hypothetical protein